MPRSHYSVVEACDSARKQARNVLFTNLRERIEAAIADLATWEPHRATASFVTTAADVRIEYHRIVGMIDALEAIGGQPYGLWVKAQQAKIAACERCPEPSSVLG